MQFQFLLGRLKTFPVVICVRSGSRFQFLLGRLKTSSSSTEGSGGAEVFQFLLGRLKTRRDKGRVDHPRARFQFLLGRLKTGKPGPRKSSSSGVSIPAR